MPFWQRECARVIVNSEHTRRDLEKYAGIERERAVVIPMGDCLGEAFYDATARIFLARIEYACKATVGDWCSYPPTWRAITLD